MEHRVLTFGGGDDAHGPPQRRANHNPDEAVPRLKRWAPKVKSGCLTCRTRRVKCDETKPVCKRCVSAKRKCGGYETTTAPPQDTVPKASIPEQPTWSSAPHGHNPTSREKQVFNLLRTFIVHHVSGGVKSSFWEKNLLQATYVYPAIWHAALAFSAMYHRTNAIFNGQDTQFSDDYHTFAIKQYTASIGFIIAIQNQDTRSGPEQEMLLTASALYSGICLLRGDFNQARIHATNAAKLSKQWRFLGNECDTQATEGVIGRTNTKRLTRDVYYSFCSIGGFSDDIVDHFVESVWHITKPFASIDEAYYTYLNIHSGWASIQSWEPEHSAKQGRIAPTSSPSRMQVRQHAFNLWSIRFEGYLQLGAYSQKEVYTIELLKLFQLYQETFDIIMIYRTPEIWAKNAHKWERIVKTAEQLLEKQKAHQDIDMPMRGAFYYSLSVQEVLRLTGFICRNGAIRRRIIHLLQQWRHCDGLWDSEMSWRLVEAKMLKEEEALAADSSVACECVPNLFFCMNHRVASAQTVLTDEGGLHTHLQTGAELKKAIKGKELRFDIKR